MNKLTFKTLQAFGVAGEVRLYLNLFKRYAPHKFAVIKISGRSLSARLSQVADDLAFLSSLDLYPIVVVGSGEQIDRELSRQGITPQRVNGLRVTDEKTMSVVRAQMGRTSSQLANLINKRGGRAINATPLKLINCEKMLPDGQDLGFVGSVTGINCEKLIELCKSKCIPVLAPLGWDGSGVAYNINADAVAREIVRRIRSRKFILITETGGVRDREGALISTIDVQTELAGLVADGTIHGGMLVKANEIAELLRSVPSTVVEICSAENMLRELFTTRGSGTFLRFGGNLAVHPDFSQVNTRRIRALLEESFGKTLSPGYFDEPVRMVIVDREYTGVAIVKELEGIPYLDKLAISSASQGNGLAKILWQEIRSRFPQLVWRSSLSNPANPWYFRNCDGGQKIGEWVVFWYNLADPLPLAQHVAQLPKTLVSP